MRRDTSRPSENSKSLPFSQFEPFLQLTASLAGNDASSLSGVGNRRSSGAVIHGGRPTVM